MTDDLDFIIQTGERLGCENIRIIGAGYYRGSRCLGHEDALDAAVDGFVSALKAHDDTRGRFTTFAYTCQENARRRAFIKRQTINGRGNSRLVNEGDPENVYEWKASHVVDSGPLPPQVAASNEISARIAAALKTLPPRYAEIIRAIYIDGEERMSVAARQGCSRQRICQIEIRSFELLRAYLGDLA